MNLDNTLAELEAEAVLVNDAIIAIQRLQKHKGKSPTRRKGGRLGNKGNRGKRATRDFGRRDALLTLIQRKPGISRDEILSKSGTDKERHLNLAMLRSGISAKLWKFNAKTKEYTAL